MNYVSECTTASPTTIMNCITHIYIYICTTGYIFVVIQLRGPLRLQAQLVRAPAQSHVRADRWHVHLLSRACAPTANAPNAPKALKNITCPLALEEPAARGAPAPYLPPAAPTRLPPPPHDPPPLSTVCLRRCSQSASATE